MIWIVITNTNSCQIYNYDKKLRELTPLQKLDHPKAKMKGSELTTDRPGRYQAQGHSRGAFSPHEEAKEVEIDHFIIEIANALEAGRTSNSYEELVIISQPKMDGMLNQHLNPQVKKLVTQNIKKDLTAMPEHEIERYLQDLLH